MACGGSNPVLEVIRSDRGRKKLALEGFLYAHDRLCVDGREMWRCDRRTDCKARIHTQGGRLIQRINEHTHPPDVEKIKQARSYLDVVRMQPMEDVGSGVGNQMGNGMAPTIGIESGIQMAIDDSGCSEFGDTNWLANIGLPSCIKQELDIDLDTNEDHDSKKTSDRLERLLGAGTQISPDAVSSSTGEPMDKSDPIFTDPTMFWESVNEAGVFDELIGEIGNHLEKYRKTFASRPDLRPQISTKLSGIVQLMEISSHFRSHLQTKKLLSLAETDHLQNEIRVLEQKALEQKRRQLAAKRKATLFQQLVTPRPMKSPETPQPQEFESESPAKKPRTETSSHQGPIFRQRSAENHSKTLSSLSPPNDDQSAVSSQRNFSSKTPNNSTGNDNETVSTVGKINGGNGAGRKIDEISMNLTRNRQIDEDDVTTLVIPTEAAKSVAIFPESEGSSSSNVF